MRSEIEALGKLVDVASDIEIGLAGLAKGLEGESLAQAQGLIKMSDGLADSLTAIHIELAKAEVAQAQSKTVTSGSTE